MRKVSNDGSFSSASALTNGQLNGTCSNATTGNGKLHLSLPRKRMTSARNYERARGAAAHYYPLVAYLRFVSYTNMWYHHSLWQTGGGVDGG